MRAVIRIALLAVFAAFSHPGFSQEFRTLQLAYGISIDVPSHWTELPIEVRKNLGAAGRAVVDNGGLASSSTKVSLLAMNATPAPQGAMIRVSVSTPPDFSQFDLLSATSSDLDEVGAEASRVFKEIEPRGGPKVIGMLPTKVEFINNHRALTLSYVRADVANTSSTWLVTQYKIPVETHMIELTLSFRQSDGSIWLPILERVKRSVAF